MSAPAVVLSGYLAGIAVRGDESQDAVELQSRVEVKTARVGAHAAYTIAADLDGARASGALRDVMAGATIARGSLRMLGELHVLEAADGGSGGAAYAGLAAHLGRYELAVEAGALSWHGELGHQLVLRVARPRITERLDLNATLIVTEAQLSAGGTLALHASRRLDVALEVLAGTRSRALLGQGQSIEALSGTQHERLSARASLDLGRTGTVFAAASVRRDTTANEGEVVVLAALAGTALSF